MKEILNKEILKKFNEIHGKPYLILSDQIAKRPVSLKLISNDLATILCCLNIIKNQNDLEVMHLNSLWVNIIVTYGKIFTKSKNGFSSLVKRDCVKKEFFKIHDKLINLRNKFVAHREDNEIENALLIVTENSSDGKKGFEFYIPILIKKELPIEDFELFENLVNDLNKYVEKQMHKNLKKIDDMLWSKIANNKTRKN